MPAVPLVEAGGRVGGRRTDGNERAVAEVTAEPAVTDFAGLTSALPTERYQWEVVVPAQPRDGTPPLLAVR